MNNRIKAVRNYYHFTQEEFAQRIGINRSSFSLLESGQNTPSERTVMIICSEFHVNHQWLVSGTGEMFTTSSDNALVRLAGHYQLTNDEVRVLQNFLEMSPSRRAQFIALARQILNGTISDDTH